jgi:hypothetical protein
LTSSEAGAKSLRGKIDREQLGRIVRKAWLEWLRTNPSVSGQRPVSWSAEWDTLKEEDKEVDRRIGVAVAEAVLASERGRDEELAKLQELRSKGLRIGQVIFGAVASEKGMGSADHDKWDANVAHRLFYIEDATLLKLIAALTAEGRAGEGEK